ncbi:regulation of nuclear pre-mRNA domain-containing protein 1B [Planococcus citri]|uniref:regulation of nuclear pre-mRNA domain-containing protein 1B n=1 Tax=Planococcus citri TaxID=170843 RepID=UPI0031F9F74C
MAGFTESSLSKKLEDLNASQQSIETLSLWLIHHRKHYSTIVKTWMRELIGAEESRQLTLMYLANDVIQNSKKKGPEYGKQFGTVLKKAFEIMGGDSCSEKTRKSLTRLLNIWEERGVYSKELIDEFKNALGVGKRKSKSRDTSPPKKKVKVKETKPKPVNIEKEPQQQTYIKEDKDGSKELHVTLSPATDVIDPPEPEELIKALMDLENSASSDATVREKIANLPPEVSEINLLSRLEDRRMAETLLRQVNEAITLLSDYNSRLVNEMSERKKVASLLRDFIQSQRGLLIQAENRLQECKEKFKKIYQVRNEVKNRLQNLPDLQQLPNVTGGLAPLPSVGDLFNVS